MKKNKAEGSWVLYDVANSAFTLLITTTLMPFFYKDFIAVGSQAQSTADWGFAVSAGSFILALLAPILGTFADYKGHKKKFFSTALFLGVTFTFLLIFLQQGQILLGLVVYLIARIGYSAANIFYDSLITDVTTYDRMDRLSAEGFGYGYIGSVIPFLLAIGVILGIKFTTQAEGLPPLGIKIAFVITTAWWLIFSLPLLKNVKQTYGLEPQPGMIRQSLGRLLKTFIEIGRYKQAFLFLIAYFFYIDGVYTIISMATAYGMDIGFGAITLLGVILFIQIVAWPFAILYGHLAARFSTKKLLFTGILIYAVLTFIGFMLPVIDNMSLKMGLFWLMAFLVASSQGGIQALSRSFFGKTIPKEKSAEFFGFYNIFGKFAAILGPLLMAVFTRITGSSRFGVLSLISLFVIGAVLLFFVKEPKS